jgi:5-methyltetrahydropteroyltriglutamate--homocysteine methyltransferase
LAPPGLRAKAPPDRWEACKMYDAPGVSSPPFRADHVGSFLRPKALLEARARFDKGEIDRAALRAAEDEAIRQVVKMQQDLGLEGITDGEYRRGSWHMDFLYQFGGVTKEREAANIRFNNAEGGIEFRPSALRVASKLKYEKCIFGEDFEFLKSVVTKGTPKLTIPSPSMMTYRGGRNIVDQGAYPDMEEFWDDLGSVYADEVEALGKLGVSYLQMDDTSLAYLNDPNQRDYVSSLGMPGAELHLIFIKVFNAALAKRPQGMTVCTHLCRGNFRSSWVASGGYDYVADALFNQLNVDGYFLEFDDDRSGGFEPLRFVPKGKKVVLGLITSKRPELESKDAIKRRLEEASKYVPLEQICLSPQCGFSSTVDGNSLTWEEQTAKLRLVVETAREVWG